MAPLEVLRDHPHRRIARPVPVDEARLDAGRLARAEPVAAVEHQAVEEHDGFEEAVGADVGGELGELLVRHEREQLGGGVRGDHRPSASTVTPSARRAS